MLFVVAAGNNGTDNDTMPFYPQSYAMPNMITVAATNAADLRWGFSNVGPTTVHLGAPGVDIVSTTRQAATRSRTARRWRRRTCPARRPSCWRWTAT